MKFFVSMLKSNNKARKISAIAILVTAVLLLAAMITLIVSSIVIAANNGKNDQGNDDEITTPELEYTVVQSLDDKQLTLGEMVKIKDTRTKHPEGGNNQYYATYSISVPSTVQKNLDAMLVANYNANKSAMISDTNNSNCNIPVVKSIAANGTIVTILTYDDENNKPYTTAWLTNNATRYGFVQNGSSFIYVGIPHAAYMAKNNIFSLSNYTNALGNGPVRITASDALSGTTALYEIYHIANGQELSVPSNFAYTVISDGNGGYIIAADLSKPISAE